MLHARIIAPCSASAFAIIGKAFLAHPFEIFKSFPLRPFGLASWRDSVMNETGAIVKRYFQDFLFFSKFFFLFIMRIIFITSSLALALAPSYNAGMSKPIPSASIG